MINKGEGTIYAHLAKFLPGHVTVHCSLIPEALSLFIIPHTASFDACSGLSRFAREGRHEDYGNRK